MLNISIIKNSNMIVKRWNLKIYDVNFGIKISKSVIHFWRKKLKPYISEIVNQILE